MIQKKNLILNTARILFNEKGYHAVTIRMIAEKLEMSSGNLNYHFKKREDLFENLYFEMVSELDKRIEKLPTTQVTINQIVKDIEVSMKRMLEYTFFWTDLYNLLQINEIVQSHFQEAYQYRINGCLILFKKLQEDKLMLSSSDDSEYQMLAIRMVQYGNTWLYATGLYENNLKRININKQVRIYMSILFPYLSDKGKQEFNKIF